MISHKPIVRDHATKPYVLLFLILYFLAFASALFIYRLPLADLATTILIVGAGFSLLAWLLTKNFHSGLIRKPVFKSEGFILSLLIGWITLYITCGGTFINSLLPENIQHDDQWQFFIVIVRKIFVFVLVPFFIYRIFGFSIKDFGLTLSMRKIFTRKIIFLLIILSASILLFEYFLSGGAKPIRDREFSALQLLTGLPLTFLWMCIETGFIEEFFFRALLQSRLAVLIKSEWGAILISGLIFGLAHVPGLYLRGAESEGITEKLSVWFWLSYCIVNMSVAGIFLGIVWAKTKNLYAVIILHAMVDLLPNLGYLINTWKL